jgi:hypothetical protein
MATLMLRGGQVEANTKMKKRWRRRKAWFRKLARIRIQNRVDEVHKKFST